MEAFNALVGIHNVLRWVLLLAAAAAIGGTWHGVVTNREWTKGDRIRSVCYVAAMHLQILLGLILYVQSPMVERAFADPGWAMGERTFRFFFVEHITLMILAAVVVQVGSIMAKRADEDAAKHKRAAILFTIGAVLIVAGIPWWRPLIPAF